MVVYAKTITQLNKQCKHRKLNNKSVGNSAIGNYLVALYTPMIHTVEEQFLHSNNEYNETNFCGDEYK